MEDKILEEFQKELTGLREEVKIYQHNRYKEIMNSYIDKLPIKKGDYIYNVTGIIKVTSIAISQVPNGRGEMLPPEIIYYGDKYKWVKGGYITQTKTKEKGKLYSFGMVTPKVIDKDRVKYD